MRLFKRILFAIVVICPILLQAQTVKVVTNHVGYEADKAKQAIVVVDGKIPPPVFRLINTATGEKVLTGKPVFSGPVDKWKNWVFYTVDFSTITTPGTYSIEVSAPGRWEKSYPFTIGKNVLEAATISDVLYYFKGQRSSGLLDAADHHLHFAGKTQGIVDAHGGWYDATGDYGKHLSHLSFSAYFNPQQIPLTVWSLLKTYGLLTKRPGTDFRQYNRRILDEAMYGADYLVRMQAPNGSFYRSVSAPGPGKKAVDREIGAESKAYTIKKSKDSIITNAPNLHLTDAKFLRKPFFDRKSCVQWGLDHFFFFAVFCRPYWM